MPDRPALSALARLVALLGAALALSLLLPSTGVAMRHLSSDVGDADPCAATGDDGGTLVKRNVGGRDSPRPVDVLLQCSPKMEMPFGTLIADDIVAKHNGGNWRGSPFFRGGMDYSDPGDTRWLNTKGAPFIHGDIAESLRLQKFQADKAIRDALITAGATAITSLGASVIICAVGGIPTLGISCAAVPVAIGAAIVEVISAAASSVIKDFLTAQYNRYSAMADADWFVWSDTKVIWNSFGEITDTTINPSLTNPNPNPFRTDHVRIGVQFSNVPVGQGADWFSAKENGAGASAAVAARSTPEPVGDKRIRTGTDARDTLRGAGGDDTLRAHGHDDRVHAGAGADNLDGGAGDDRLDGEAGRDNLFAGPGDDSVAGGAGHDVLVGGPGRDLLAGGPGADTIVDAHGPTVVRTGAGGGRHGDFVNVRDGRGDDTVICEDGRSRVVVDRGDRVRGRCGAVVRSGGTLTMPARAATATASARAARDEVTPVIAQPLPQRAIVPVKGSDGRWHAMYELLLTNTLSSRARIDAVEVLDAASGSSVARYGRGALVADELLHQLDRMPAGTTVVPGGQARVLLLSLPFRSRSAIPRTLEHRLTVSAPDAFTSRATRLRYVTARVAISRAAPPVLAPPLRGSGWLASDGCCRSSGHVSAIYGLAGQLQAAERYAIDWIRLTPQGRIFDGDPKLLTNWPGYGAEITSVADGVVTRVLDGLPDQVPQSKPGVLPFEQLPGNHVVVRMRGGRSAVFAHFVPGSIRVRVGQRVRTGDPLGRLGNSGASLAPHLHFHVVDGDSAATSPGYPFTLDRFGIAGHAGISDLLAALRGEAAFPPPGSTRAVEHRDELPLGFTINDFPG